MTSLEEVILEYNGIKSFAHLFVREAIRKMLSSDVIGAMVSMGKVMRTLARTVEARE